MRESRRIVVGILSSVLCSCIGGCRPGPSSADVHAEFRRLVGQYQETGSPESNITLRGDGVMAVSASPGSRTRADGPSANLCRGHTISTVRGPSMTTTMDHGLLYLR